MKIENEKMKNEKINQVLEERARLLARRSQGEALEGEYLQLLTFPLGEEKFGVEVSFVREVQPLERQSWSLVPCTPDFIVGAVNIRGRIYSMMHVGRFLDIKTASQSASVHVLLVGNEEEMEICILTDDMPEIERIPTDSVQTSSETISIKSQEYIHGVTEDMVMILDLRRLLADTGIIVNDEL